jgi:hypothetical protein
MTIQIEQKVQWTEKAHPIDVKLPWFPKCNKKQNSVALSTTETEHIAVNEQSNVASQTSNRFV